MLKIYMIYLKKFVLVLLILVLTFLLGINIFLIIKNYNRKDTYPDYFGYSTFVVGTNDLSPQINFNDLVITNKVPENELSIGKSGDTIVFYSENEFFTGKLTSSFIDKDKSISYISNIKGEGNLSISLKSEQIVGKIILIIPLLGGIVGFLQLYLNFILIILFILLLLIIFSIVKKESIYKYKNSRRN